MKNFGENKCDFELRAVYAANFESGEMHVYAHSEHNHPFEPISRYIKSWIILWNPNIPMFDCLQRKDPTQESYMI
jgi:hypothetical protein